MGLPVYKTQVLSIPLVLNWVIPLKKYLTLTSGFPHFTNFTGEENEAKRGGNWENVGWVFYHVVAYFSWSENQHINITWELVKHLEFQASLRSTQLKYAFEQISWWLTCPSKFEMHCSSSLSFFLSFFLFFFLRWSLALLPGWSAVAQSRLTATSASWVQAILPLQPPE